MIRGAWAVAALALAAALRPSGAEVVDRIVATVDGEPITLREVERYAADRGSPNLSHEQILQALITDKLLEREVKAEGIVVRDDDIDAYVAEIKSRNHLDDGAFTHALAAQGMTLEAYRARVKSEIEKTQLVSREIRGHVTVSPQEIERYYQAHLTDYETGARVTVRDIFFPLDAGTDAGLEEHMRAKAEEVRALAVDGRSFEDLARQFSEGPGADKGGLLGTFARGEMDPPLEEAAFKLAPKEVSPVVRTSKGFHILRADAVTAPGHRPLDDVRDDIRESLYNQQLESRFSDWLSRELRERHHVEVLD
ncbi:MAG TPA: peptidylprolyl isomerase [Candidatus Binatia bacterium]|nr:peptidylprolyl isomerase [Candidatus Binatia bacterium]